MNRKLIIGVIVAILGIVVGITVYLSSSRLVVAKVDGLEVTKAEYLNQKLFMEQSKEGGKVDREQVLREIGRKNKLVALAKESGIHISDTELLALMESQKQLISQADPDDLRKFHDMLRGQGLTEAEYWSSPEVRQGYKNGMYIARLRQKIGDARLKNYVGKLDIELLVKDLR